MWLYVEIKSWVSVSLIIFLFTKSNITEECLLFRI